jgi:hypothetical protein
MLATTQGYPAELPSVRISEARHKMLFAALMLFVAAVSVHDATLVVLLEDLIYEHERNPIGCLLIELAQGSVWLFVITKLLGTAIVGAVQVMIYQWRRPMAMTIAAALAGFQFGLLMYLSLA